MHVDFVLFQKEWIKAVAEFNGRLREGGQTLLFPESPIAEWLPKTPGRSIFQELFLAVDRGRFVRGGYMLKHQNFWLGGKTVSIGDFQLPVSEGIIDRRWLGVGIAILRDIERREPLLYALGMGDVERGDAPDVGGIRMEPHAGALLLPHRPPLLLPAQHRLPSPQTRPADSAGLLAFSGLGWLGIRAVQDLAILARSPPRRRASN